MPIVHDGAAASERLFPFDGLFAHLPEGAADPIRLGIMGGTFDPIHLGHLACAEMARDACALDGVIFLPAGNPSFKRDVQIAPAQDRLTMCEIAVADDPHFAVSSLEVEREGVTYTVDTLEALHDRYGDALALSFIIGTDSLLMLSKWRSARRLSELAEFVCVARPGYMADEAMLAELRDMGFLIRMVEAPLLDISSSEIKRRIRARQSVRYLAPLKVCEYIESKGLYMDGSGVVSDER